MVFFTVDTLQPQTLHISPRNTPVTGAHWDRSLTLTYVVFGLRQHGRCGRFPYRQKRKQTVFIYVFTCGGIKGPMPMWRQSFMFDPRMTYKGSWPAWNAYEHEGSLFSIPNKWRFHVVGLPFLFQMFKVTVTIAIRMSFQKHQSLASFCVGPYCLMTRNDSYQVEANR